MPLFTKLNSIRSSVHMPFASKQSTPTPPSPRSYTDQPPIPLPHSRPSSSSSNASRHSQQPQQAYHGPQRQRTISTPTASFAETLKVMSKQVQQQNQFDDAFASFFFTEKRCRNRAIFMAARLAQSLGPDFAQLHQPLTATTTTIHSFWKRVMDRFYTLNYLLFVVPSNDLSRKRYLEALEQKMGDDGIGAHLKDRRGGLETYFALCYAMQQAHVLSLVEDARKILEHCLDSENKLGHSERDAMYIFHGLRAGFLDGHYEPDVALDDDDFLLATLRHAVMDNKKLMEQSYVNPFEDDACIVDSDDDCGDLDDEHVKSRHSDSGFYEDMV